MTTLVRQVQKGQSKRVPYLCLHFTDRISERITSDFLTTRRANIPVQVVGRLLNAMAIRRIQSTSTTSYSQTFDVVVASFNAIVPSFMNMSLCAIPVNGAIVVQGENVNISVLPSDFNHMYDYIRSPLFVKDINIFKAFSQAQGIAMVSIDCFVKLTTPLATARVKRTCVLTEAYTIPFSYHYSTVPVEIESLIDSEDNAVQKRPAGIIEPQAIDEYGLAEGRTNYPKASEAIPDDKDLVLVPLSSEQYAIQPSDINIRTSGRDDVIDSAGKSFATLFPIFIFTSGDEFEQADWLDLLMQTKLVIKFDDLLDQTVFINSSLTFAIRSFAAEVFKTSPNVAGLTETRVRGYNPVPAEGLPAYEVQHTVDRVPIDTLPNTVPPSGASNSAQPLVSSRGFGLKSPPSRGRKTKANALGIQRIPGTDFLMPKHGRKVPF